jgi:iron complex transport system substrate-binding protein
LFGRAKGSDLEALVAVRPDIIIDIGSIDPTQVFSTRKPRQRNSPSTADGLLARCASSCDARHPIPSASYYARGPKALETALAGSLNTQMLGHVGAVNVAADPGRNGLATVSAEQILAWDPEVIITLSEDFYRPAWCDPIWQGVAAVRGKRIYLACSLPFGWFDLPAPWSTAGSASIGSPPSFIRRPPETCAR